MTASTSGFVDRIKGKGIVSADSLTQSGKGGAVFKGGGNIYANSSSGGFGNPSNTTANILDSYSLPANSLSANNYILTISAFGVLAANTHSKTVTLSFGSESASFINAASLTGGTPWMLQMNVFKTGANTQFVSAQNVIGATPGGIPLGQWTNAAAETDTAAIPITVTGLTGTAGANDIVLYGWFIEASNY